MNAKTPAETESPPFDKLTHGSGKLLVFVDGECSLCHVASKVLDVTDRARCTEVAAYQEDSRYRRHGVSDADAATRLHVINPTTGRSYAGFEGLRHLTRAVPLLWPLRPVFSLLTIAHLGERLYEFVARNRPRKRR